MAKKKKKKAAPAQTPMGAAMAAAVAGIREKLNDPETQVKIAQGFAKLRPQVDALKAEMESGQAKRKPRHFGVDNEGRIAEIPSIAGELRLPDKHVPRAGRLDFYWICDWPHTDKWDNSCAVKASYWKEDSVSTQDIIDKRPGARHGDWTVDIIGYNGGAMFRLDPHHAKRVAEAVLSAVGFETEWRKYYAEHGNYTTEGGEMGEIPHADPGPAVGYTDTVRRHETTRAEGMTPDIPTVVPIARPDNSQSIPGGGTSQGPTFEEYMAKGGENPMDSLKPTPTEAMFLGHEPGFGDSETPKAAPKEHRCCGHCKPDAHAPHTDGCPSGFNISDDDEWPTGKVQG